MSKQLVNNYISPDKAEDGTDSNGFALINVIWLLLLGAALVSAIQLATISGAENQNFDHLQTQRKLAMESAFETAVADIFFYGNGSRLGHLPAVAHYQIEGLSLSVHIAGENGKLDLNQAEPALIDRALRGLGIPSSSRDLIIREILAARNINTHIQTIADIERIFETNGVNLAPPYGTGSFCPSHFFTIFSGLPQPSPVGMDPQLARALNLIPTNEASEFQAGQVNRITIKEKEGTPLTTYVRITGHLDNPVKILDWSYHPSC